MIVILWLYDDNMIYYIMVNDKDNIKIKLKK